jgi:hypothetical protein
VAIHNLTVTVQMAKSIKTLKASVNAHNGKGAIRVFLLKSEQLVELKEAGGDIIGITVERDETQTARGLVCEEVQKAPRKAKVEAVEEPAAE